MSESVMMALAKKGVNRQEAHEMLRQLTIRSALEKKPFKQVLQTDKIVSSKLNEKEIDQALNPKNYLGTAVKQAELFAKGLKNQTGPSAPLPLPFPSFPRFLFSRSRRLVL